MRQILDLALDQALTRFARKDARQAQVVELRYVGGLTEEEVAEVWNLSLRTVKREWPAARDWPGRGIDLRPQARFAELKIPELSAR